MYFQAVTEWLFVCRSVGGGAASEALRAPVRRWRKVVVNSCAGRWWAVKSLTGQPLSHWISTARIAADKAGRYYCWQQLFRKLMIIEFFPTFEDSQVDVVAQLARAIWSEHYRPIIGELQVAYMLKHFQSRDAIRSQIRDGYEYYLVRADQRADVGYLALQLQADHELFLSKVYVLQSCRGQGVGHECFEFVGRRGRELGARGVTLTVNKNNTASISAYERWGFKRIRSIVTDIGGGYCMDDWEYRYAL